MSNKPSHKVLVVDDEESIVELLKYNLEKDGYEVKKLVKNTSQQ